LHASLGPVARAAAADCCRLRPRTPAGQSPAPQAGRQRARRAAMQQQLLQQQSRKSSRARHVMTISRVDWAQALVLCVLLPGVLDRLPPFVRDQPLDDPFVLHPHLPDTVPSLTLLILSLATPIVVLLATAGGPAAAAAAVEPFMLGLVEANGLTVTITGVLKLLVGRPRPHFAAVCVSYVAGSLRECTGDPRAVAEARKSFPSGHSSLAFSTAVYLAAYLAGVVGFGAQGARSRGAAPRPTAWKLLALLFFPMLASLVAVSRTRDWHHNYDDIVCGSVVGGAIAGLVAYNRLPDVAASKAEAIADADVNGGIASRPTYETVPALPS
jgi:diacylglycerol diphosphate phosphatase / phosphatidate phosphatase